MACQIILIVLVLTAISFNTHASIRGKQIETPLTLAPVEIFQGQVIHFEEATHLREHLPGTHMLFRTTDGKELTIVLGPSWYLEQEGIKILPNAEIEVEGVVQDSGTQKTVVVNRIKLLDTGKEFILRDNKGIPAWR